MLRLTALALIAFALWPTPGSAAPIYPWCAHYLGRSGGAGQNCGFVSFEQCMASVRGVGGTCQQNPFYAEPQNLPRRGGAPRG